MAHPIYTHISRTTLDGNVSYTVYGRTSIGPLQRFSSDTEFIAFASANELSVRWNGSGVGADGDRPGLCEQTGTF